MALNRQDRIQKLHRLLSTAKKGLSMLRLAEELECTEQTVKKVIDSMRESYHAPIEYSKEKGGWYYDTQLSGVYELPGLWLTSDELQSLALLLELLAECGKGVLSKEISIIDSSIEDIFKKQGLNKKTFHSIIKILPLTTRQSSTPSLAKVCDAILLKRQLEIRYIDYYQKKSHRYISPQQIIYYRENWYVDAWCHSKKEIRTFSLPRLLFVDISEEPLHKLDDAQMEQYFGAGYGIFSGQVKAIAKLKFLPPVSYDVAMQTWHPQQKTYWGKASDKHSYYMEVPYAKDEELCRDILTHMPYIIVKSPTALRKKVLLKLQGGIAANQ